MLNLPPIPGIGKGKQIAVILTRLLSTRHITLGCRWVGDVVSTFKFIIIHCKDARHPPITMLFEFWKDSISTMSDLRLRTP